MDNKSSNSKGKWFKGVDSLRFILAVIVLFSHLKNPIALSMKHSGNSFIKYIGIFWGVSFVGIAAVIAFFVISGFVIHYPNREKIGSLKNFYIRRYLRVLVPLVPIIIIGHWFGNPESAVVWSLYCELIYYTVYPLLAAIKINWNIKIIIAYAISTVVIVVVAHNTLKSMLLHKDIHYIGDYATHGGISLTWLIALPFWLLGVNLASKIDSLNKVISFKEVMTYRLAILATSIILVVLDFHFFVPFILSMSIISFPIAKWVETEICYFKNNEPNKYLERWGKFSYSLYLCHPLAIVLLGLVVTLNNYTYLLYLLVVIFIAYLFYLVLERPSHLLAQKLTKNVSK